MPAGRLTDALPDEILVPVAVLPVVPLIRADCGARVDTGSWRAFVIPLLRSAKERSGLILA